jgi:hypothetical protein
LHTSSLEHLLQSAGRAKGDARQHYGNSISMGEMQQHSVYELDGHGNLGVAYLPGASRSWLAVVGIQVTCTLNLPEYHTNTPRILYENWTTILYEYSKTIIQIRP